MIVNRTKTPNPEDLLVAALDRLCRSWAAEHGLDHYSLWNALTQVQNDLVHELQGKIDGLSMDDDDTDP